MIYVYVEDKKEGLLLLNNAVQLYLVDTSCIYTDSFCGIYKLVEHIELLNISDKDIVYYIYDNVPGNTDVPNIIKNAKYEIILKKLEKQVYLLPILCCEYSILTANNIELFSHIDGIKLIQKLKQFTISANLTTETKQETAFLTLYNRIRKEREKKLIRRQKKYGSTYTQNDIEKAVTIEKLCKEILKETFQNELRITDKLGDCWDKPCCIKHTRICSIDPKSRLLHNNEKKQFLAEKTIYLPLISKIAKENGLQLKHLPPFNFTNLFLTKQSQSKLSRE